MHLAQILFTQGFGTRRLCAGLVAAGRVRIGGCVMGGDIAAWCALRGLTVTLQDQTLERILPAYKRATELFAKRLRDPLKIRDASDRMIPDPNGDGAAHADVVIEAIFESVRASGVAGRRPRPSRKWQSWQARAL